MANKSRRNGVTMPGKGQLWPDKDRKAAKAPILWREMSLGSKAFYVAFLIVAAVVAATCLGLIGKTFLWAWSWLWSR